MMRGFIIGGLLIIALAFIISPMALASIITDVFRSNGQLPARDLIGVFDGSTAPLATKAGSIIDDNLVFSDRTYPRVKTPAELIGAEYTRTFNTDKNNREIDVTCKATVSTTALVVITIENQSAGFRRIVFDS